MSDERIYASNDVNQMIADVKAVVAEPKILQEYLTLQHQAALAESVDAYTMLK